MTKTYAPPKLRQMVTEAFFRRARLVLLTVFVVVGLVLAATLLMHKRYQAEAKLMVENVRSMAPLGTSPSERLITPNDVSTTEINNEMDLLQSQGVARLTLGEPVTGAVTQTGQDRLKDLEKRLDVAQVHQSSTIDVKLMGSSPEEAAKQLQRLIDAYFQERAGAARSGGAADFFDAQAQSKSQQVDADQKALTDFEIAHQIADLDDQKKIQVARVGALQDQLLTAQAQLASTQSRLAAQRHELAMTPQRTRTTERTITNQYSQERLGTTLVDLENRRTELLKRYPPTDRQVIEVNEKIQTTRAAMAAATQSPAADAATDANPTYQQLSTAAALSSSEVSAVAAQRGTLTAELKDAKDRLTELEQATADYDALKRNLARSQADYALYAQKRDEARVSEALDKAKMFDVSLVQAPLASPEPVRPKPALYLAAALVFALLLGTALALYADTSAEQVHTPAQLDQVTGTRTLATFADEDDADAHAERNRVEYRRVLVALRTALGERAGAAGVEAPREGRAPGYTVALTSALAGEGVSFLVDHLAEEAAREPSSRVAVLDMEALLAKFEGEGNVSFGMKFNAAGQYWTLALHGDAAAGTVEREGGSVGQFPARLRPLLVEARREFDYLLLDCPSLQASALATELDICVDGYVGVVSAGQARKQNIEQMAAALEGSRAPLLGYVLNRRRYPVPAWLHKLIW